MAITKQAKTASPSPTSHPETTNRLSAPRTTTSSRSIHLKRRKGLPRPKTPQPHPLPTPSNTDSQLHPQIQNLYHHTTLLTSLLRRNKNQHRAQPFFKHLLILRRSLLRLLSLTTQLSNLSLTPSLHGTSTSAQVRATFEAQSHLRTQRDALQTYIRDTLVPECYVRFSGLVADTQFAGLGIVLVGILAGVAGGEGGVGLVRMNEEEVGGNGNGNGNVRDRGLVVVGTSTRVTGGVDLGVVVERVWDGDGGGDGGTSAAVDGGAREMDGKREDAGIPKEDEGIFGGFEDDGLNDQANAEDIDDTGEAVVSREPELNLDLVGTGVTESGSRVGQKSDGLTSKKKKKKGKSAIDDLFQGLI